jgi:hypothetical protein
MNYVTRSVKYIIPQLDCSFVLSIDHTYACKGLLGCSTPQLFCRIPTGTVEMSLNTLPAELTAWIVLYLPEPMSTVIPDYQSSAELARSKINGLSRYTGSSIGLQYAIECRLFSTLTLTSDDLATFDKLVS